MLLVRDHANRPVFHLFDGDRVPVDAEVSAKGATLFLLDIRLHNLASIVIHENCDKTCVVSTMYKE